MTIEIARAAAYAVAVALLYAPVLLDERRPAALRLAASLSTVAVIGALALLE